MRYSNHSTRGSRWPDLATGHATPAVSLVGLVLFVLILGGCGPAAAASASPTPVATPVATPDPHLKDPVTADQLYQALSAGHLTLYPNNATKGPAPVVKRINLDLDGWPLRITAYDSAASMQRVRAWKTSDGMRRGDPPYAFAALNILIEFGPMNPAAVPALSDSNHQADAAAMVAILDPLLWPIEQHSVSAIPARTAPPPAASVAPGKAAKSPSPIPSKAP